MNAARRSASGISSGSDARTRTLAVAVISIPIASRSPGVRLIMWRNSRAFISGAVSLTEKPVSAYLSGSILLTIPADNPGHSRWQSGSPHPPTAAANASHAPTPAWKGRTGMRWATSLQDLCARSVTTRIWRNDRKAGSGSRSPARRILSENCLSENCLALTVRHRYSPDESS